MPALTLWLKTSLSLSFFERLKGGVVWSFCLNKCLNSFSRVLIFFFRGGRGNASYMIRWIQGIVCCFFFFLECQGACRFFAMGKNVRFCVPSKQNNNNKKRLFSLTAASPPSDVRGPLCVVFQQSQCQVGNE